jgi:DNA-directed RNA polymerase specialized sigma24 family protein
MRDLVRVGASLEEIEAVYRSRVTAFSRVAAAVAGGEAAGADSVHEAFVKAVRYRRRFRGKGSLEAWLWRIVLNEAKKARRTDRPAIPVDEAVSTNGYEPGGLSVLVSRLPERQRIVLFLRYYADFDYEAIAAALGIAPGTVAATLNAAHTKLKQQLEVAERCEI